MVESRHRGHLVAVDSKGRISIPWEIPGSHILALRCRSHCRRFTLVEEGGIEYFGLTAQELAVICSRTAEKQSISGSYIYLEENRPYRRCSGMRTRAPMNGSACTRSLLKQQAFPACTQPPCGKHSGMLALCQLKGLA